MPGAAAAAIGGTAIIGGALIGSGAAKSASKTQAKAADQATNLQRDIYNTNRADLAPWRETGSSALKMLADSIGLNGPEGTARGTDAFRTSPGYDFAFEQGKRGVAGTLAAKSMSRSGAATKALTRYGQGTADQEYGTWINRLGQLAGFGQTANTQTGNAANAFATGASNTIENAAAARASGYVGSANAISGGVSSLAKLAGGFGGGGGSDAFSYGSGTGEPGSWSDFGYAY